MNENRLENLKEEKNLKSTDIAKNFKVNKSTYSEWEHNKIPIPTKRIVQFADFYKVNIDYLLKFTDNRRQIDSETKLNQIAIGKKLKEIRIEEKLSLRKLGEKLNFSYSSLASYEKGKRLINCNALLSISKLNSYSIDWILDRSNQKYILK